MGSLERVWWIVVECCCRLLGISTAAVLCAVGVETLREGEFHSLAIYLLVSAAGMMLLEVAYFLDAMLAVCLPLPPGWIVFVLWGKMARLGGFQKFLCYSIMSVVCFLHPVLVWHAVIPGTMLLATAFFNFILSKKPKMAAPKGPQGSYGEPAPLGVREAEREDGSSPRGRGLGAGERGESAQAMLGVELAEQRGGAAEGEREGKRGNERRRAEEREMEEMEGFCESETTSDTAPMITD